MDIHLQLVPGDAGNVALGDLRQIGHGNLL